MIPIREIEYDTQENPERAFSRLAWAVERVDGLASQLLNGFSVDTHKRWVGIFDQEKMSFKLMETSGFIFNRKLLQIIIKGRITQDETGTKIFITLKLGWNTAITYATLYGVTAFVLTGLIDANGFKHILYIMIFVLVLPVLGTFRLYRKLNKIEKTIE